MALEARSRPASPFHPARATFPRSVAALVLALGVTTACAAAPRDSAISEAALEAGAPATSADAAADGGACLVKIGDAKPSPLVLELVLDGSGSMDSDDKWIAASKAVLQFFDDTRAGADPTIALGLLVFEDQKDLSHGTGPYPTSVDVAPAFGSTGHFDALAGRVKQTSPSGGTPTELALGGAHDLLRAAATSSAFAGASRVAVLISDGVPNGGATEQAKVLLATKQAALDGIRTAAVGVGPFPGSAFSYDPRFMSEVAQAGQLARTATCNPATTNVSDVCHYQVTPQAKSAAQLSADIFQALLDVRRRVHQCELALTAPTGANLSSASVVTWSSANGQEMRVAKDATDGWTFDDPTAPTKVVLHGAGCATFAQAPTASLTLAAPCGP